MSFPDLSCPHRQVGRQVLFYPSIDSTNEECRRLAQAGAQCGTVVIAGSQTRGRGRQGRAFQSLADKGLYLSVLLRPQAASMELLSRLTPWAAVAVCRALEGLTGLSFSIKWVNDVLLEGKKLCGILTELSFHGDGALDCAVLGIGIDLTQTREDFGPTLSATATSLGQHMAVPPTPAEMAGALLTELDRLWRDFPHAQEIYLEEYRRRSAVIGRAVRFLREGQTIQGTALGINGDFSLQISLPDGGETALSAGEISVCL